MDVLCVNVGSATLKVAVYRGEECLFEGASYDDLPPFAAIGHRVVHGGVEPARIDANLLSTLRKATPLAPLHLPRQIDTIEELGERFPDIPQVACFDTAFHETMPPVAKRFPLPASAGVRRYGFHGLSYEYIASQIGKGRAVLAHLGNGASLCALKDGKSLDTTMGLTPTGGIMSGTRSGDLDPGVIFYLLRHGYTVDQLEELLNHGSGLLGVSGVSADMHILLQEKDDAAIELFCYQVKKQIGAYAAVLGGLDLLVFTGGIGEHAEPIRQRICAGLDYLACEVRVVATNEDLMVARHTEEVLG